MKATTPPRFWASASTCWQSVVLPDDSGPKISVIRPRGMPPTPIARSSAIEPVGMESTACRSEVPSFMIEPRPNCFSIARMAASTARVRSLGFSALSTPLLSAVAFVPVIAIPEIPPGSNRGPCELLLAGLRLFVPARFALGLDYLDCWRRGLQQRLQLRLHFLRLGLLLRFLVRAIPLSHFSRLHGLAGSLAAAACLTVHSDFAPACLSRLIVPD